MGTNEVCDAFVGKNDVDGGGGGGFVGRSRRRRRRRRKRRKAAPPNYMKYFFFNVCDVVGKLTAVCRVGSVCRVVGANGAEKDVGEEAAGESGEGRRMRRKRLTRVCPL